MDPVLLKGSLNLTLLDPPQSQEYLQCWAIGPTEMISLPCMYLFPFPPSHVSKPVGVQIAAHLSLLTVPGSTLKTAD